MSTSVRYRNPSVHDRSSDWLPWGWCNLWRNPFGELTREERAVYAVVDIEPWIEWTCQKRVALQFIGRSGRGKTTRMLALHHRLPDSSYTYLAEDKPCPAIVWGRPVMIDEAQRLSREARRAVFASGEPLVLATHRCLARPLRAAGYEVRTVSIGRENDANLVWEMSRRRIESSRLGEGPVPVLSLEVARRLVARFGTNLRAIEGYLYERVQTQCYSHGEMRFID